MAHSHGWQLMVAVGWEFKWSCFLSTTHDLSTYLGFPPACAGFSEGVSKEQVSTPKLPDSNCKTYKIASVVGQRHLHHILYSKRES